VGKESDDGEEGSGHGEEIWNGAVIHLPHISTMH
jgi:hypothetical protein